MSLTSRIDEIEGGHRDGPNGLWEETNDDPLQPTNTVESRRRVCRRFRDRISVHRQRPDRQDQDRPSHAADRLSRRARRLCPARHSNGGGGNQPGRRRHGPAARRHVGRFGQSRHRRHQGAAHAGAGWRGGTDGRDQLGLGADHHAGGRAQQAAVHANRRALRRAARQELQPIHLPRRYPEHRDGERRRQGAVARQHGEGQEVLYADRRLHLRPRSRPAPPSRSSTPMAAI